MVGGGIKSDADHSEENYSRICRTGLNVKRGKMRLSLLLLILLLAGLSSGRDAKAQDDQILERIASGHVRSLDWSPDGKYIAYRASGLEDSSVSVVGLADRSTVFQDGDYWVARWSPDGELLALGGDALTVLDWETQTTLFTWIPPQDYWGETDQVSAIAWNGSGNALALLTAENDLVILGVPDGDVITQFPFRFGGIQHAPLLDWSPDGSFLAAQGSDAGALSIWQMPHEMSSAQEAASPVLVVESIPVGNSTLINDLEWNPASTELAWSWLDLDVFSISQMDNTIVHGDQPEYSSALAWSPDGSILADSTSIASESFALNFWDSQDHTLISHDESVRDLGIIHELAWSPDGTYLALASDSGLWLYRITPRLVQHMLLNGGL
jgi:WD40 repeat protein